MANKAPFQIIIEQSTDDEPRVIVEGEIFTKKVTDMMLKPFAVSKSWFLQKAKVKAPTGRKVTSIMYDGTTFTKNKWEPLDMKMEVELIQVYKKPIVTKQIGIASRHNVANVKQKYTFFVDDNRLTERENYELDEEQHQLALQEIHNGPEDSLKVIWGEKKPTINDAIDIHAAPINRSGLTLTTTVGESKHAHNLYHASAETQAVVLPHQTLECVLTAENSVVMIDIVFRVTLTGGVAYVYTILPGVNSAVYYPINNSFWGCNHIQNYYGTIESSFHIKNSTTFAIGRINEGEYNEEAVVDEDDMKKIE